MVIFPFLGQLCKIVYSPVCNISLKSRCSKSNKRRQGFPCCGWAFRAVCRVQRQCFKKKKKSINSKQLSNILGEKSQLPSYVKTKNDAAGKWRKFMLWLLIYVIIAVIDKSLRNREEAMEVYNALTFAGKDDCHNCQNFNKYLNFSAPAIMRSLLFSDLVIKTPLSVLPSPTYNKSIHNESPFKMWLK